MYRTEFGNQEEDWDRTLSSDDERLRWILFLGRLTIVERIKKGEESSGKDTNKEESSELILNSSFFVGDL